MDVKIKNSESISPSADRKGEIPKPKDAGHPLKSKRKFKKSKTSGVAKFTGRFTTFGATVKKLWDVWGRFKTKTAVNPNPSVSEKTLGIPGFEEIACIEAEVPDIMTTDKDRVRTSCKECMKDPPTFPTKEQIKAKLIAADKYYGVRSTTTKKEQSGRSLEHDADYYDVDGTVVKPSWRFILERPLVEQYVLMTNYIRKVSVLSEIKETNPSMKLIKEEDSGSDTEYKKFEQEFIKDKRKLLQPMQKPKTQDMAVQTSIELEQNSREILKESVSEMSLYPESEESTNSPEASAVTIVTSRDYSSPLQSDFDGRTTDKSTSYREGKWWEPQATCQTSESFQTSYDSIHKNTSSGTDGQSIPIHSTWGTTHLQPSQGEFSNVSDPRIIQHCLSVEPTTHRKPKDKKVSFSPVVTYYQGPNKNAAVYNLQEDHDHKVVEPEQQSMETNPPENEIIVNPKTDHVTVSPPEHQEDEENSQNKDELAYKTVPEIPKQFNRKMRLENVLQGTKRDQIVSVSIPSSWHKDRIIRNKQMINVAVSRPAGVNQPAKKISFQEYEEIPDVVHSDPNVSKVQERADANIQTQIVQNSRIVDKFKPIKQKESPPPHRLLGNQTSQYPEQTKALPQSDLTLKADPQTIGKLKAVQAECIGTETSIQSVLPIVVRTTPRSKSPETEKKIEECRTKTPVIPKQANCPKTNLQTSLSKTNAQPRIEDSGYTHSSSVKHVDVNPSAHPNQKQIALIPGSPHHPENVRGKSNTQQQQSTDTEGSSTSNEHLRLKASPACLFKVATPTDLSKISVDEFYPDVPEIDAELSQIRETKSSSAPRVEIVFADKETALKFTQEAVFHKITRSDECTLLHRSANGTGNSKPNTSNKGKKIIASPGVGIKIDESSIEKSRNSDGKYKSSDNVGRKARTKDDSQQISVPQTLGGKGKRARELLIGATEEHSYTPSKVQANVCKTDPGNSVEIHGTWQDKEKIQNLHDIEVEPIQTIKNNETSVPTILDVLQNEKNVTAEGDELILPGKAICLAGSSKGKDEMQSQTPIQERTSVKEEHEKVGIGTRIANGENDEVATIQCQLGSGSLPGNQLSQGRTKLYTRTLSSLIEETSSAMGACSSTQEKLIDMPMVARSIEALKTIFEKKSPMSGESEIQVEESCSSPKKCAGLSKDGLGIDEAVQELVSVEMKAPTDEANENPIASRLKSKIDQESKVKSHGRNTQGTQNLLPAGAVKLEVSDAISTTEVKSPTDRDEKSVRSGSSSHCGNDKTKNSYALVQEESSVQHLSQIEVVRASEIYSNTSMYFSTSEDCAAKMSKARVAFQPVTLDADLEGSKHYHRRIENYVASESKICQESSKTTVPNEKILEIKCVSSEGQTNKGSKQKAQGLQFKTNNEGDNASVGQENHQSQADGKGETEATLADDKKHQSSDPVAKTEPKIVDTGSPTSTETKHWLMDVIPVLSRNTRFHSFRSHKPVCVKEVTEAEAVKFRQEAVKPVFKFLKRQREMEDN